MNAEENIKKYKIILPKAADPVGSYVATKISGKQIYVSGQISIDENGNLITGKLGKDLNVEKGTCKDYLTGETINLLDENWDLDKDSTVVVKGNFGPEGILWVEDVKVEIVSEK